MQIFIGRHAQADNNPIWQNDEMRPITKEGKKIQYDICKKLLLDLSSNPIINLKFEEIWASPLLRVQETLEIYKKVLKIPNITVRVFQDLRPDGNPTLIHNEIIKLINIEKNSKGKNFLVYESAIIIIGHNPCIYKLINILVPNSFINYLHTSEIVWIKHNRNELEQFSIVKYYSID